jgi:small subunit ribosomal protein S13
MARIAGVNVPDNKRIPIAMSYVHGIGRVTAFKICKKLGIDVQMRMGQADEATLNAIRQEIEKGGYKIEGDQASFGHEMLSWFAPQKWPSGSGAAH